MLIVEAVLWSLFATVLSQLVSIFILWVLQLSPRRLAHEIEDEQNPAVGAIFFVVAVAAASYIGPMTGDGYDEAATNFESIAWIAGGLLMAITYTMISFIIAHRLLEPINNETMYQYIRRELIAEKNMALALFLGALMVVPFIVTAYQII